VSHRPSLPPRLAVTARRRFADRRWLDDVRAAIEATGRRVDWRRNRAHVAELIAAHADRRLRSRPTMTRLAAITELDMRTVQLCCRWLERGGWLDVLEPGTTPEFRPGVLAAGSPNLAREWALTVPGPDGNTAPTQAPTAPSPTPGAREATPGTNAGQGNEDRRSAPDSPLLAPPLGRAPAPEWPLGQTPQRRGERLTACETLQRRHMVLRRLSARRLRSILRPWFGGLWARDGQRWTPADVLHALDHRPDGTRHEFAGQVRDPGAWLAHRLGFWLDGEGHALPSHSAVLAARAAGHAAVAEAARAEREAAEDARLGTAGQATRRGAALARQLAGGAFGAALARRERLAAADRP
jgi:hypothetical protein